MWYRSLTILARALAQYLLVFPKLPGRLHLPPEKEKDTVKFVVTTLEVRQPGNSEFLCGGRALPPDRGSGSVWRPGAVQSQPHHAFPSRVLALPIAQLPRDVGDAALPLLQS